MGTRRQLADIPGALRATLERARGEFRRIVREVPWGLGPLVVVGDEDYSVFGAAAAYAFETLVGGLTVAGPPAAFSTEGLSRLTEKSALLLITKGGEWSPGEELARSAQERGCTVIALSNTAESPLLKLVDYAFLVGVDGQSDSPAAAVSMLSAINLLAFDAMRNLKRPERWWPEVEREFDRLPETLEWVLQQFPSVARAAANEIGASTQFGIVAGGAYQFPARYAAGRLEQLGKPDVASWESSEYLNHQAPPSKPGDVLLLLSGSRSKTKKSLHRCAAQARGSGARVLSLTDSNDHPMVEASDLVILVPALHELPAASLALFMLEWLAFEMFRTKAIGN